MDILNFNSTQFIFGIISNHWLILAFLFGLFKIYAKRSKSTWDDEVVSLLSDLKDQVKQKPETSGEN